MKTQNKPHKNKIIPSPVNVGTLRTGSATKFELSIGPGIPWLRFSTVPELLETPELDAILQLQQKMCFYCKFQNF